MAFSRRNGGSSLGSAFTVTFKFDVSSSAYCFGNGYTRVPRRTPGLPVGTCASSGSMRTRYSPGGVPSPESPVLSTNVPSDVIAPDDSIISSPSGRKTTRPDDSGLPSASRTCPFTGYTVTFLAASAFEHPTKRPSTAPRNQSRYRDGLKLQIIGDSHVALIINSRSTPQACGCYGILGPDHR